MSYNPYQITGAVIFIIFSSGCAVVRPVVQAPRETGYYNTEKSLHEALNGAVEELLSLIKDSKIEGRIAVIQFTNNKESSLCINTVFSLFIKNGYQAIRTDAEHLGDVIDQINYELTVYPIVWGIEENYGVEPGTGGCMMPLPYKEEGNIVYSGRLVKVSLYARLENTKTGQIVWVKTISKEIKEYGEKAI